ncbi:hypothetical protein C8R45DRAFT_1075370 [Mycena sanguinolenta]|nr:hypothetical protein C8R45DRAFT_1075370 [Mycena sanguinolenta]
MPSACSKCGAFLILSDDDFEFSVKTVPRTLARFLTLSATNEPPRDTELAVIRPIIEKSSARLASLDAEISRLTDRLRELKEERAVLAQYHAQNTSIASGMRRMPTEILGEIFLHSLPSIRLLFAVQNSPWVLTHVCSRWRAVALSKPSLWSCIVLDFEVEQQYPLELVKMHIERAQSLKIHFLGAQNGESESQIVLFKILAEHSARWEEFSIQLTSHLIPHVQTLQRNLTSLRRVWITWDTPESQPPELDTVDFLRLGISLVDIGAFSQHRFVSISLPVSHHLTRYDFEVPWSTHSEILKSLPNLQEARITCRFDDHEQWPQAGEPIQLPHLRRLFVSPSAVQKYLKAPTLEEIVIWGHVEDSEDAYDELEGLLIRSYCSPYCLRFRGLLDEHMLTLLQKYPSFTEVVVVDAQEDEERKILSAFLAFPSNSEPTTSVPMLPQITTIGFACRHTDAILYPLFLNMVESRWNSGHCEFKAVELLCLDSPAYPDPQSVARMEKLRRAGLQISLLSEDEANNRANRWFLRPDWL